MPDKDKAKFMVNRRKFLYDFLFGNLDGLRRIKHHNLFGNDVILLAMIPEHPIQSGIFSPV